MNDREYTPRYSDKPKHRIGTRLKRQAELSELRNAEAVKTLTEVAEHVSTDTDPNGWPVVPNHRAVMLKLRVSDLEKAKAYIDGEIELLEREIATLGKGDAK